MEDTDISESNEQPQAWERSSTRMKFEGMTPEAIVARRAEQKLDSTRRARAVGRSKDPKPAKPNETIEAARVRKRLRNNEYNRIYRARQKERAEGARAAAAEEEARAAAVGNADATDGV